MTKAPTSTLAKVAVLMAAVLVVLPFGAVAQQSDEEQGKNSGNYNIRQSFEFGGRITDFSGNRATYRTFDNLSDGPRLFEHTIEMRSLNHTGFFFDDFFLTSFGYGGDPNAVTRLRAYKNKWYNFNGTFRLHRNQWDYNLLANPLNPTNSNPAFPVSYSLHKFETVRRMNDYNLTFLPQSRVRFRAGYSRNIMEGPSFSTIHQGTDALTFQDWKTTVNAYSFGFDVRVLPKTSISYDQFLYYYKGDTTWTNTVGTSVLGLPRVFTQLSNGRPVDLGIILNTTTGQPCNPAITDNTTTPPTASPTCNGYQFYQRVGNIRTNYPTEQLSFQTSYFRNLDMSARLSYSSADNNVLGFNEGYLGEISRSRQRVFSDSGPANSKRVSVTADYAVTWQPLGKLRLVDTFHFTHFRIPGLYSITECNLFGTSMIVNPSQFTGTTVSPNCAAVLAATNTATTVGTPSHATSSPADILTNTFSIFLGQDMRQNQFEVLYDFTPRFAGRLGYRYTARQITHGDGTGSDQLFYPSAAARGSCALVGGVLPANCTQNADGSIHGVFPLTFNPADVTEIHEHVLLAGISYRPVNAFRLIFDTEFASADNVFTRISPRQFQFYRLHSTYKPASWFNFGFMLNILEKRNNVVGVNHRQHNRTFGFTTAVEPNERFSLDFGYDFNDVFSQTNICFVGAVQPPGTIACPGAAALLQQISLYDQDTHYGYLGFMWKPIRRLETRLGYSLVSTSGKTLILNPNVPVGPLAFNYHRPYAAIDFDLAKGLTFRSNWGYYGYNEKAPPDPSTAARDFRGNLVSLSLRYAF